MCSPLFSWNQRTTLLLMSQQQSSNCLEADPVSVLSPIVSRTPGGHRFALVRPVQPARTALSLKMSRCEFLTTLSDTREGKLGRLWPFLFVFCICGTLWWLPWSEILYCSLWHTASANCVQSTFHSPSFFVSRFVCHGSWPVYHICMHTHADKILVVRMRFRVFTLMLWRSCSLPVFAVFQLSQATWQEGSIDSAKALLHHHKENLQPFF